MEFTRPIPHKPGCYLFKDKAGAIIYVGKAKDLKKRVAQYFSKRQGNPKVQALVSHISDLDFVEVDSEDEAILLEASLIKQHYPKYNIDLRENSPQTFALITSEKFPRVMLVRKNRVGRYKGMPGKLFGPFMSSGRALLLGPLRKVFKVRTCKNLPKKVCLQYHMGFCDGPCEGKIGEGEYGARIAQIGKLLSDQKNIGIYLESLHGQMKTASMRQQYEEALKLRDSIRALEGLSSRQKMDAMAERDEDYIAIFAQDGKASAQAWRMVRGVIRERLKYEFDYAEEDVTGAFLLRFYQGRNVPGNVYVNRLPDDVELYERHLAKMKNGAISVMLPPTRGQKFGLMQLIEKNIVAERSGGADPALLMLQKELKLERLPFTIECFDISNLQGNFIVGSMVQLVNGRPKKSGYRKFKVRTVSGQDDFASIREVVFRRYRRLRDEGGAMPDLVLVDGGLGQLHAAIDALKMLEVELPVFALAKGEEEVYGEDMLLPLRLAKNNDGLHVLQRARDEAHRFVISYHRKLRGKNAIGE